MVCVAFARSPVSNGVLAAKLFRSENTFAPFSALPVRVSSEVRSISISPACLTAKPMPTPIATSEPANILLPCSARLNDSVIEDDID